MERGGGEKNRPWEGHILFREIEIPPRRRRSDPPKKKKKELEIPFLSRPLHNGEGEEIFRGHNSENLLAAPRETLKTYSPLPPFYSRWAEFAHVNTFPFLKFPIKYVYRWEIRNRLKIERGFPKFGEMFVKLGALSAMCVFFNPFLARFLWEEGGWVFGFI